MVAARPDREFSAGGVVVRGDDVAVVVPARRDRRGERVLALPKGHPEEGESTSQAAEREVREETGLEVDLREKLGEVRYWYQREGRRILKVVTFFLFAYRAGDVTDHDHEIEEARWMPLAEAERVLTYPGERRMAGQARARLAEEA